MERVHLKLFLCGNTPSQTRAKTSLLQLCEERLQAGCRIDIIDVLDAAWEAEKYGVIATPTIIKVAPLPQMRVIGDLRDASQVLLALNLDA